MCNICGSYSSTCGCNSTVGYRSPFPPVCCPDSTGCPVQLDFGCIFYHKNGNKVSGLTEALDLPNGISLEVFAEVVDSKLAVLDVEEWSLPFLKAIYDDPGINNLQQFGEAVDDQFKAIDDDIIALQTSAAVSLNLGNSATISFTLSGALNHTGTASVRIATDVDNQLTTTSTGLYVPTPHLNADYTEKTISIVGGNTIDMLNFCGCDDCFGYLGETTADPTDALNGQTWFRTDLAAANGLKIKVNGAVRTITTS